MNCQRCGLDLPPGSTHAAADSCVTALRAELAALSTCRKCQGELVRDRDGRVAALCPGCAVQFYAAQKAKTGLGLAGPVVVDWLKSLAEGGDEPPPGRKRFVP